MEKSFWHKRWERNEIAFHRDEANTHILKHVDSLGLPSGAQVCVPLCGKSRDLIWLQQRGFQVVGVELSELAILQFFQEHNLDYHLEKHPTHKVYHAHRIRLYCCDFFDLPPETLRQSEAVFDCKALIALPKNMREQYSRVLIEHGIDQGAKILLATYAGVRSAGSTESNSSKMQHQLLASSGCLASSGYLDWSFGPPFAVNPDEVSRLFSAAGRSGSGPGPDALCSIECVDTFVTAAKGERFVEVGIKDMAEYVFVLQRGAT